jgi:uncharacterized repeat protein (TIGR01451 family)
VNGNLLVEPAPTEGVDVRLTSTSSYESVVAGKTTSVRYSFTVKNIGTLDATNLNISLTGILPPGVWVESIEAPRGTSFSGDAADGTWTIRKLRTGKSATLWIELEIGPSTAPGIDVIQLTATAVSAEQSLINTGNDSTTQTTSVAAAADLAIVKHTATSTVSRGGTITYRVTVKNKGPNEAVNVILTDLLPEGTTFISQTQNSGPAFDLSHTDTSVTNTIDWLDRNKSATFTILAHVENSAKKGQKLINKVEVSSDSADPESGNNASTATTKVTGTTHPHCQNPGDYPYAHKDVDGNGYIEPNDVLLLLERMKRFGIGTLPEDLTEAPYYDVDGDDAISPADVLQVLDHINLTIADFAAGFLSRVESSDVPAVSDVSPPIRLTDVIPTSQAIAAALELSVAGAPRQLQTSPAFDAAIAEGFSNEHRTDVARAGIDATARESVFSNFTEEDWLDDRGNDAADRFANFFDLDELELLELAT